MPGSVYLALPAVPVADDVHWQAITRLWDRHRHPPQGVAAVITTAGATAVPDPASASGLFGVNMQRVPGRTYLGTAPPNPTDSGLQDPPGDFAVWNKLPNSVASLYATLHYYAFLVTPDWISGMRNMMHHTPAEPNDTPLSDDVLAYHTILAMSPVNRRGTPHQFRCFFNAATLMFSITGLFDAIVRAGGYPSTALALAHYPFLTDNVLMAHIATWFVQRGIAAGSPDVLVLESFAQAWRNMKVGIQDLENSTWTEAPCTVAEAISMFPVPNWRVLEDAPPAMPMDTMHPCNPAGNDLASLLHAPMTGIEADAGHGIPPPPASDSDNVHLGDAADDSAIGGAVS
ncbi:hypothetical protein C8J57DRAFT_1254236 [Mycena rebaudengoi]|nr:hypothetical protein C8J57DRAFT_1254236 [Mycena rebaudengoi]